MPRLPRPPPPRWKQHSSSPTHSRIIHLRRHENSILSKWSGGSKISRKPLPILPEFKISHPNFQVYSKSLSKPLNSSKVSNVSNVESEGDLLERERKKILEKWSSKGLFLNVDNRAQGSETMKSEKGKEKSIKDWGYYVLRTASNGELPVYSERQHINNKKYTIVRKIQGSPVKLLYDLRTSFPQWNVRLKEPSMNLKIEGKVVKEVKDWLTDRGF